MCHVSSRSGVATLRTAIHLLLTYLLPVSCRNDSEIRSGYGLLFERVAAYRPRQTILTTRRIDEERTQNSRFLSSPPNTRLSSPTTDTTSPSVHALLDDDNEFGKY